MFFKKNLFLVRLIQASSIISLLFQLSGCGPIERSQTAKSVDPSSSEVVFQSSELDVEHSLEFQKLLDDIEKMDGEVADVLPNGDIVVRYPTEEEANSVVRKNQDGIALKRSRLKKPAQGADSNYQGPFRLATRQEVFPEMPFLVQPHTPEELKSLGTNPLKAALARKKKVSKKITTITATDLPSKVDLSESDFFPGIGNQGPLGSCTAWASGYYTNSFEYLKSRKLVTFEKNPGQLVEDSDLRSAEACSPSYIFALANGDRDPKKGLGLFDTHYILGTMGCASISEVSAWANVDSKGQYDSNFFPTIKNQIEGMKRRVTDLRYFLSLEDGEAYPGDQRIQEIKAVLNAGYWIGGLGIKIYDDFDHYFGQRPCDQDKVYVFGRCLNQPQIPTLRNLFEFTELKLRGYHAVSIAGYDDDKEYTDLQGKKQKGAFKVANQWGKSWGDQGFFWVPYEEIKKGRSWQGAGVDKVWPKDHEGFPDETHSYVTGYLYYFKGVKKLFVKKELQVKFKQTTDEVVAYKIQVGEKSKTIGAGVAGSEDWNWAKYGRLSQSESWQHVSMSNLGIRVKKNQELTLIHDISDLLKGSDYPVEVQVTAMTAKEGQEPGTEILGASLYLQSQGGFISKPLALVQVSKSPASYLVRLDNVNDLPEKPKAGSFCAPNGRVTLYYCAGDLPEINGHADPSWVSDPASIGCYQHSTLVRCDLSDYNQGCKTRLYKKEGQLSIAACGCTLSKTTEFDDQWTLGGKKKSCYLHRSGVLSF